ncbi:MAG TPA: acetyl-CoA carboxylase biotin carboxylase subunit [Methanoregulaceae archaeon]|nr:MAG: acetyl-CoA carboxylase biotin carboxylase subunit [Methanolinea sp.]HON82004.1 acetyl-CoA carboxylase biotin carboxylase subunit [Methanoregulaceae archaeon]HPD11085.1 acetyl-CoA carboxylase biotin carboxylase subunit [Methanoregulaceae archaeon]HRT15942.1 acetyl-CoA carboxylase biotin carboxylase subunit [Methanoregulaceae archaeon]HRU31407.1 acetyl-CoA carboxylase biotin carboxylase subunit [Methanoregulaceae archaeon]
MKYFEKVLIANRGEIAIRVMRACREMNIETIAIYSTVDKDALHVKYADGAFLVGEAPPAKSYLNVDRIIDIARLSGSEAIHPGYGFLAENYSFAKRCTDEGITFIGPSWKTIQAMGSKIESKQTMRDAGVPVVPGSPGSVKSAADAHKVAAEIGYPVIVKASAGGGGIGMQIVGKEEALDEAINAGMRMAESAFGDSTVFIEKYLGKPRHIEFQVLADEHGNVVHLYDRECSIQRRHQKLVEEAPCPIMTPELRERMAQSAITVAQASDYWNAGTVEFLYADGDYYFMEMNTRLQVEHTVTELITGIDIVKQQLAVAAGETLPFEQDEISIRGHAIECRINAEDPLNNFAADPGKILRYRSPGGPGMRVDSGIHMGYTIPAVYDSMIAKLCSWGMNRQEAIARMRRAIYEYVIIGVKTTLPFHHAVMHNKHFINGDTHTHFLQEGHIQKTLARYVREEEKRMQTLAASLRHGKEIAAITGAISAYIQSQKEE